MGQEELAERTPEIDSCDSIERILWTRNDMGDLRKANHPSGACAVFNDNNEHQVEDCSGIPDTILAMNNDNPIIDFSEVDFNNITPLSTQCDDLLINELKGRRDKHHKNLFFAHVNVNSIKHKFDYFKLILSEGLIDVLCITETKLDNSFREALFSCKDYKCYRKDRTAQSGGMMVFVRSDIPHKRICQNEISDASCHIENILIEFDFKKFKLTLICVYKNPNVQKDIFVNHLSNLYDKILMNNKETMLLGDVNIDMAKGDNIIEKQICTIYDLKNIIKSPTCFKSESGTLIDPIIVSNTHRMCNSFNIVCGESDFHNLVGCMLRHNFPAIKPHRIHYRSYKNFNESNLKKDITHIPTQVCDVFDDINDKYWAFSDMFKSVLEEHAPIKSRVVRSEKIPYMSSDLMKAMYKRNNLKNKYIKYRTTTNWESYRMQRNLVVSMRRCAIRAYFMKHCSISNGPKNFWSIVKPFFSNKSVTTSTNIILKENNNIISDTQNVCDVLNEYFVNIAEGIGSKDQMMTEIKSVNDCVMFHSNHPSVLAIQQHLELDDRTRFEFSPLTVNEIQDKLKTVNRGKPAGFDNIPAKIVQICHEEMAEAITMLINNAFIYSEYPADMKKSEISPIFKKKDITKKENYRPINIIGVLPKIFESLVARQIEDFMSSIFSSRLGAYRKGHGCSQVLISAIDSWKRALDKNDVVGMILMDLSKAFDAIPHDLLIAKLYAYGFSTNACKFILSYLTDRLQRVKLKDKRSTWCPIKRGIPQGSCLGPLLFNVFINDLFLNVTQGKLFNYADDNTLSASGSSFDIVINTLTQDSENAINWFKENFMQANPNKFQVMFLKPARSLISSPTSLQLDNTVIQSSNEVLLLGIYIDDKLNFDKHVSNLCKKAARQLNILIRFQSQLRLKEKEIIFKTFILSNFNFCPIVWHFCSKQSARNMEKIQERALRFLSNDYQSSYASLLRKTGYISLHLSRLKSIAVEVFKCTQKLNPTFMNDMFTIKESNINLRDPSRLYIPRFDKIQYGKKTFSYYGSHLWNLLPHEIKRSVELNCFKALLRTWEGPSCSCNLCCL